MVPTIEPKNFDLPVYLPAAGPNAPAIAAGASPSPSSLSASSPPSTPLTSDSPSSESPHALQEVATSALSVQSNEVSLSEHTRRADIAANYQPIESIFPQELSISSDVSVTGPKMGLSKDGIFTK